MSEWQLFPDGTIPEFAQPAFFSGHPWIDPVHQRGHAERIAMVAELVADVVDETHVTSVVDLGCGDGSLLGLIQARVDVRAWGYDLGIENQAVALVNGVDVRIANFLVDALEYGDMIVATEVVEHLLYPRSFIRRLPGNLLVLSSPCDETDAEHYEHHTWAWDMKGYRAMVEDCGWHVREHRRCDAGFQALCAVRT